MKTLIHAADSNAGILSPRVDYPAKGACRDVFIKAIASLGDSNHVEH